MPRTLSLGLQLGNPQGDKVIITGAEEAWQDWVLKHCKEAINASAGES